MGRLTQYFDAKAGYVHSLILNTLNHARQRGYEIPAQVLVVDKEWMYTGRVAMDSHGRLSIGSSMACDIERSRHLTEIVDNFPAEKLALIPSSDVRVREAKGIGRVFGRDEHYLGMMRGSKQVDVYNVPGQERVRTRYWESPKKAKRSYTRLGLAAAAILTAALSVGALAYVLLNHGSETEVAKPITDLKK